MKSFKDNGRPECYISETYNYLIQEGRLIKNFHIDENQYISLGTPYDLTIYQGKVKEFYTDKPKTIFCDIDGTIFKYRQFGTYEETLPEIIPSTLDFLNKEKEKGSFIVLTSARPQTLVGHTMKELIRMKVPFDRLIMGIGRGTRYLINDRDPEVDADRAVSINLVRDKGFTE